MSERSGAEASSRPTVTAVVVSHNGAPWLHELIAGIQAQTRPPDRVVTVDTGSLDDSRELLVGKLGGPVIDAPARTGFGAAVGRAVQALPPAEPGEWLWLLHDDCAPDPGALEALVRQAESAPEAAVLGPKLRDWPSGRRLLEIGVTIAGSGARETGLEFGEYDQGQHDGVREVLAVSTAGMFVRRDVFERLGGFDPHLPLFRDDVDFGWRVVRAGHQVLTCPDAVVHHAEAGHRHYRHLDAVPHRPRLTDRRNALYTLLVNSAAWRVPFLLVRLAVGSLLRVLGLLVAKWPDAAYDEFRAFVGAYSRPDLILRARRRRARQANVGSGAVRRLLPPPWIGLQHAFDGLMALVSARSGTHVGTGRRSRRVIETGPVAEETEELDDDTPGVWRWLVARPALLVVLAVTVVTLVACRNLLGGGELGGGALLPAPDGAADLWRRAYEGWHPVELGSGRAAPPYLTVLALVSSLFLGKAWLAVDVLLLGSVPLAAITCYLLMRPVVATRPLRLWATATYALLPVVTGAVAAGRIGTCVAIVVLPLVALAVLRTYGPGVTVGTWSAAWAAGLLLAVLTAFVPVGYVAALLLGLVAIALPTLRKPGSAGRIVVALAVPPLALLPWLPVVVRDPGVLLGEAGLAAPGLAESRLAPLRLAFGSPGGPGAAPVWMFGLLCVVALVALLRRDRARGVLAAWGLSLAGLALGLVQSRLTVVTEWVPVGVPAWPGLASVLILAGWILAIVHGADGARRVFRQRSFSWRQPGIGVAVVVAVLAPMLVAGWWIIRGADGPVNRDAGPAVPAYIRAAQKSAAQPRALVIQADDGAVRYALLRGAAARFGDAQTGTPVRTLDRLDTTVGDLLGDTQREATAARLAGYDIGYVYLPAPADAASAERLDATPGLIRSSAPDGAAAWKVDLPVGRLRILDPQAATGGAGTAGSGSAATSAKVVGVDPDGAAITVPDGPAGRLLVLAEAYDQSWRASLAGEHLKPVRHDGWAQAFELPTNGGRLVLDSTPKLHGELLAVQGFLVFVFLILALPTRQRRDPLPMEPAGGRRVGGSFGTDGRPGRRSAAAGAPAGAASAGDTLTGSALTGSTSTGPHDPDRPREGARNR